MRDVHKKASKFNPKFLVRNLKKYLAFSELERHCTALYSDRSDLLYALDATNVWLAGRDHSLIFPIIP